MNATADLEISRLCVRPGRNSGARGGPRPDARVVVPEGGWGVCIDQLDAFAQTLR